MTKHASSTGQEAGGPFRSPPVHEFVLFSESVRMVLECLEINTVEGTFVAPSRARLGALAIVEATTSDGTTCDVRLVGKIHEIVRSPYPLLRVRWNRAVSHLPPSRFFDAVAESYGFLVNVDLPSLDERDYVDGTEYDFARQTLFPRGRDAARGGGTMGRKQNADGLRRYRDSDADHMRDNLGVGTTIMLPTIDRDQLDVD